ncbi:MAG: sodium-dependent transporter [Pirellulaceae bacterium]|nr:sodium-dependent transporter [Pirellulaceae bacterium]
MTERDRWASRIGLVLAMAGNAIGLGNFLRFPRLAAQYGGGAFLIPYLIALLLLGFPIMWVEWTMGRYGGQYGHSTSPGMFARLWRSPAAKYLGALGIALPLLFTVYYTYIESWTLAYACFSAGGRYMVATPAEARAEIPPAVPGFTAAEVRSMLGARGAGQDSPLSRAQWTGPDTAFTALDANVDGRLDTAELRPVLQPLAGAHTNQFLREYQGVGPPGEHRFFDSLAPALGFWLLTVALNTWIISRGIAGGVEKLAKVAMPLLFLFAVVLVVRVFTWGTPDPSQPDQSVWVGLNFIWQPNFAALADFNVWLAAAGQIFFTLSIGTGAIQCYASYLKPKDDCILTGLTTAATNEFAEVVLGATIAIPIAVATFGLANTQVIAGQGSFDLGFVALPIIFEQMPGGRLFGTLWFALLFFAGVTSSVALCQPLVAFLQETFHMSRRVAALVCGAAMIVLGLPIVLWLKTGYLDQYDFWVGTFGLVVFALIEVVLFAWMYGGENMWHELRRDAEMRVPRVYYYVIRYVVPLLLMVLLGGWCIQSLNDVVLLEGVPRENVPYIWLARATIVLVILAAGLLVLIARRRNRSWPV